MRRYHNVGFFYRRVFGRSEGMGKIFQLETSTDIELGELFFFIIRCIYGASINRRKQTRYYH